MSDRLLIGTRKGLFDIRHAAQALGHFGVKLQRSTEDGDSWTPVAGHLPPINCVRFG